MNNKSRDKARTANPGKDYKRLGKEVQPLVKNNNPKRITSPGKSNRIRQMNNRSRDTERAADQGKYHESLGKEQQPQVKNKFPLIEIKMFCFFNEITFILCGKCLESV
jgi:hypothetical protein